MHCARAFGALDCFRSSPVCGGALMLIRGVRVLICCAVISCVASFVSPPPLCMFDEIGCFVSLIGSLLYYEVEVSVLVRYSSTFSTITILSQSALEGVPFIVRDHITLAPWKFMRASFVSGTKNAGHRS